MRVHMRCRWMRVHMRCRWMSTHVQVSTICTAGHPSIHAEQLLTNLCSSNLVQSIMSVVSSRDTDGNSSSTDNNIDHVKVSQHWLMGWAPNKIAATLKQGTITTRCNVVLPIAYIYIYISNQYTYMKDAPTLTSRLVGASTCRNR